MTVASLVYLLFFRKAAAAEKSKAEAIGDILQSHPTVADREAPQFSDQALEKILKQVDGYKGNKRTSHQKLKEALFKDLGKIKGKAAFATLRLTEAVSDQQIIAVVNHFWNREKIALLPKILFEDARVQKCLARGNRLTDEMIELFKDEKWQAAMDLVEKGAKTDLWLDETFVNSQFGLQGILQPLPEEKQQLRKQMLQQILNEAYINRALRERGGIASGTDMERHILNLLGYQIETHRSYNDKEKIYEMVEEVVTAQLLKERFTGTIKETKVQIQEESLKARLATLGLGDELRVLKFKVISDDYQKARAEAEQLYQDIQYTLPLNSPIENHPLATYSLNSHWKSLRQESTVKRLDRLYFHELKKDLNSASITPKHLQETLNQKGPKTQQELLKLKPTVRINLQADIAFKQRLDFYNKWGKYLLHENIQGLHDLDEVFGKGVCWGNSSKILFRIQKNRSIPKTQVKDHFQLQSRDRFLQAKLTQGLKNGIREETQNELAKRKGFTEVKEHGKLIYNQRFSLCDAIQTIDLEPSNGWLLQRLYFPGAAHATLVRIDPLYNAFWYYDPNHGLFCFEEDHNKPQDSKRRLNEFFHDLIESSYPELTHLYHDQLI